MSETDASVSQLSFAIFDDILPQPSARVPHRRGGRTEETWAPSAEGLFGRPVGEAEVRGGMAIWPDAEHWWRVGEIATRTILLEVVGDVHARDIAEYATRIRESENPILPATIDEVRALLERHAARIGVASRPAPPATPPEPAVATGATPAETAPRPIVGNQGAATAHTDAVDGEDDGGRDAASAAAGSGDHSAARVAPRVVVEAAPEETRPDAGNFYLSDARPLAATWRERAHDNIAAIALMKEIEAEGRAATPDEQARLITYVGWGASDLANNIFPTGREARAEHGWEGLAAEVRAALTPREYADARRGTQYSHYTPEPIVRWVWAAVRRLGFDGGAVLEPGMGTGLFIGLTPPELRGRARFTGIEFDSVAAGIARLLYPGADVRCQDFATSALPPAYDLAVGNPPFSDLAVTVDPAYRRLRPRLHDYFMVKSVDLLRPGGLLAFVTSRGTLDKANDAARRYIADRADLVAAVRLPRGSFMATAGTDTVVDIVILRKRGTGEAPGGPGWMSLAATAARGRDDQPIVVNEYFAAHPEMALGTHRMVSGRFGQDTYTLDPTPDEDLASALATALDRLPVGVYPSRATTGATAPSGASTPVADAADAAVVNATPGSREGSYLVARDGTLMQIVGGVAAPVPIKRSNSRGGMYRTHARIVAALIPIRDAVRDILREQARDGDWAPAQRRLRAAYDRFVAAHGPINLTTYPQASVPTGDDAADGAAEDTDTTADAEALAERGRARTPNLTPFLDDPDAYLVASIEIYNEETGEATKGPIFTGRVVAPPGPPEIVSSHDALNVVLNERGRVDIPRIAELLAWAEDAVVADLGDAIFLDPATERWEMRDAYLSGDVRAKLQMAETAMELDPRYRRNVEALRDVLPVDLKPSDVTARLGQPWIPTDVVEAFAQEVLGGWAEVRHTAEAASWSVNAPTLKASATGTSEWGTDRRNAGVLLEDALNARTPQIYDTVWDGPVKKEELNVKATEAAREKLAKIKAAFQEWVWRDSDRALRLLDIYNQRYNSLVPRHFDGSHLTLPGISCVFQLYDHQKRAIWRTLSAGSTYLAHAVGAGKTATAIAAIMEQKRLGLVAKPIIVVPNSTLKQWAREFMALYPHAKILVADEVQFHRARRQRFLARAATGIWDAVVITHSAFPFIPVPEDFERELVRDQLDEFAAILADVGSEDRVSRKQIERQMEGMRQRIETLASRKDDLVDMAEIGIDQIIVDEAHLERKLSFPTNMGTIKGVDPQGSQRAWDLWVKSRYVLRAHNPKRGLVLASGTPVTNTLGEMFTIQRYLQEDVLRARDLHLFDAWASTFGDVRTELELQPSGKYKSVSRFAEFVNVPELIQMFRSFADVLTSGDLKGVVALPRVHGGRREIVRCPASDSFKDYQATLARRIAAIEARKGPPRKGDDILLSVITDGRHAAMDMRLVERDHPDEPANKINACIDNVARIWEETASRRYRRPDGSFYETPGAAQMVFSDLGTPAAADKRGFSVYHWIRERLIVRGVPARQIAFMQDYDTSERKLKLFQAVNAGTVRVLIGSTATMGVGVNAQTRLAALHHVCVPWVPADLEQREGRIVRQGNQNEEVRLYAYATLGSLDAQMWQTLERKAKFIEAALKGDTTIRRMEDVGESQSNQFAIAKALASGDERLLRKAGLDGEVGRLRRLKAAHFDDQIAIRRNIDLSESAIGYADKRIAAIEEDIARRRDTRGDAFRMTVDRAVYTERKAAGAALLFAIGRNVRQRLDGAARIGDIGGFDIRYKGRGSIRTSAYDYDILIERTRFDQLVHIGLTQPDLGVVATLEHALRDFEKNLAHYEMERITARRRVADFVPRLGQPFEFDQELIDKQAELDALEADLARAEEGAASAAPLPLAPPAASEGDLSPGSGEQAARHAAEDGNAA